MDPESLHKRILCWLTIAKSRASRAASLDRAQLRLPLETRDLIHGHRVPTRGRCQKEECAHE